MSGKKANTALMVAHGVGAEIAFNSSGGVAEWIMLLPSGRGGALPTVDGRGPWRLSNPEAVIAASLQAARGRLPIDENHATDLAAPSGGPSPARGWASELQARADGIYGRVEWSASGAALMGERAYRFISPAFTHDAAGNVTCLLRASLTNTPNLRDMPALNSQENDDMDLLAQLRKLLGLPDDADQSTVLAKVQSACGTSTAMNSIAKAAGVESGTNETIIATVTAALGANVALQSIAKAAGLKPDADAAAITTAVSALAAGAGSAVTALQAELASVTTKLNSIQATHATDKATSYVDGQIKLGRVGVKPLRDHYIAMHSADPARVEKEISAMPILGASGVFQTAPPENKDGVPSLNSAQIGVAKALGIDPKEYAKTLAAEQSAA